MSATTVYVQLYNRIAVFDPDAAELNLNKYYRFQVPNYRFMPAFKQGRWDGYISLLQRGKVSAGLFLATKDEVEKEANVKFKIEDLRESLRYRNVTIEGDHDYQLQCIEAMLAEKTGGIILSATGTGKTRMVGSYFKRLIGKACFVVDELMLLKQTKTALEVLLNESIGEIGDGIFDPKRITVATIQTLHLHKNDSRYTRWTKELDVMVIDEAHLALNRRNNEVIKNIKPAVVFELTATLELQKRHIALPAYALGGKVIFEYALEQADEEKRLAPGVVCAALFYQDGKDADYQDEYREMIVENDKRNQCVVDLVKEAYKRKKRTVLLVERVGHLKHLSDQLKDIPHRKVFGEKEVDKRMLAKEKFNAGKVRLLIANKVFKKGIDITAIDCIVECSALKSKNDAIQKFGRGKRLSENKTGLIYIDINDRSFDGAVKGDDLYNRFQLASKSRLKAFKDKGVPVVKVSWSGSAEEVFDAAEKTLVKYLKKLDRKSA